MFCVYLLFFFLSLCLFVLQLLFLNTCQKVINGVGWLDSRWPPRSFANPIYMTQQPSLFTLISYCAIVFSFALICADGWFTACEGFYGASAYWLSHMKQQTITITIDAGSTSNFTRMATDATKRKHYCKCKHFPMLSLTWLSLAWPQCKPAFKDEIYIYPYFL